VRFQDRLNQGGSGVTENSIFRFTDLSAGQSITIAGLTLTANSTLTASAVTTAFGGLAAGSTGKTVTGGTFSGTLTGWSSNATANEVNTASHMVAFRSITSTSDVTDITYSFDTDRILRDNDTFVWQSGDAGTGATDTIKDFKAWNDSVGDRLNITNLLEGYTPGVSTLADWVSVATGLTINGMANSSRLTIDVDGAGASTVTQIIELEGATLNTDLTQLLSSGVLIA